MRRSCTPTSTPSSPPSSSATTRSLRGRPVIVGIGVVMCASYEARARGVRGAMGGGEARRLCPDAVFVAPRLSAYTDGQQGGVRGVRRHHPVRRGDLRRRGVPRRRRAAARSPARPTRSPCAFAARSAIASACRSASASPARSSSPRWPARCPSRTACSSCRPATSSASSTPCRSSGCGASAPRRRRSCTPAASTESATSPPSRRTRVVAILGRASGPPHPRPVPQPRRPPGARPGAGAARSVRNAPSAGRRARPRRSTPCSSVSSIASRGGCAPRDRVGRTVMLRLRFDDFTRATRSHTLDHATADTATILTIARGLLAASMPRIGRDGVTLVGLTIANLDDDDGGPADAAVPPSRSRRRRARRRQGQVRVDLDHPGRAAGPRRGHRDAPPPRLTA